MPRINKRAVAIKASEAVVSRMLSAVIGMRPVDTLRDFREAVAEHDSSPELEAVVDVLLSDIDLLYQWKVDIGREVMGDNTDLQTTLASNQGVLYVVNDTQQASKDGLWLAIAEPPRHISEFVKLNVCRGLFHTIEPVPGEFSDILAIQLTSCLKT